MDVTHRGAAPSAIVIPIALPPAVTALRDRWDRAAADGAGPHVTILYPFLPAGSLDRGTRSALRSVARAVAPFEVSFASTRRTAELVWLDPTPSAPFAALTTAVTARWPDMPPYGGAFEEVVPHLTIVEAADAPLDAVETAVREALPIQARAERLEVWQMDPARRWRPRWRIPLGIRP